MPVLAEALSVIVSNKRITEAFGSVNAVERHLAGNQTYCTDGEITRVGFMDPTAVDSHLEMLAAHGLSLDSDVETGSIAVVDQLRGLLTNSAWLDVFRAPLKTDGTEVVTLASSAGSTARTVAVPKGWQYSGPFSEHPGFLTAAEASERLELIGIENGIKIYRDRDGKLVYVAE